MRKSQNQLNVSFKRQIEKTLAQAIADFNNLKEVNNFLKDFLTETEYEIFAKRLAVAYWLKKGRSYQNIKQNIKVSSATIAEVKQVMQKEGFKLALKKVEAEEWSNQWAERIMKFRKRIK
ncbi:hypothetical protein A2Z22_02565 [Candidatus Woesebacteria bacterium RBG_16_34_12]|uniref:TrpR like protein, YerC/YecD n=2 Tax=Candidatus Woeseibacteriota TaxID=1752722 RepID=A0A1F7X1W9_9BACT|nr:MAG: hypothetical protein A2159_03665 [Candidatus Woesebacteria bacterium RBG_13_34_9]OGM11660.1 MAG: hypothetical protein A2Z22_02565 [Candidatus Woesebacteria bacterium RBG_16_34_12]